MALVLLFNKVANPANAARIHVDTCPLVAAARNSRGRVAVIEGDEVQPNIEDLIERIYVVRTCKCAKGA